MRSGRLRHYVDLQQYVAGAPDAAGDPTMVWTSRDHVWVSIDPVSMKAHAGAREMIGGGAQTALDLRLITLYPYPDVSPVGWRVVDENGVNYDIKAERESNDTAMLVFLAQVGGV